MRVEQIGQKKGRGAADVGPVAAIGELLAKKPNARIAIVQGSFDWFHSGHLSLVQSVASAAYDLVVVMPTREYDRKPYLRNAFERRLELASAAIDAQRDLKGRVVVSDAMRDLPSNPADLVDSLLKAYPGAKFGYALGTDSFDQSADHRMWKGFGAVEKSDRVELIAVQRGGYTLQTKNRAGLEIDGPKITISSTEIREALYGGDLNVLRGRVPPTTFAALQKAQIELEKQRRAGQALLGATRPSEKNFAVLSSQVPSGGVNVLERIDEKSLSEGMRQHLATLQERVNTASAELQNGTFAVAKKQLSQEAGFSNKVLFDGRIGTKTNGQFLHKPMSEDTAAKIEMVTVLSNLLGLPTALAMRHNDGVTVKMVEDLETATGYDYKKADPKVLEYLMLSRWLNDVIGNLDTWSGQFLVPSDPAKQYKEMLNIDFDEAFNKMPAEKLHDALENHFHIQGTTLEDCQWRDRDFRFGDKITFDPLHLDSRYTFFGPLIEAYVEGRVNLDIEGLKEKIRFAAEVPKAALVNVMQPFLQASEKVRHDGLVHLPAGKPPEISQADFERKMVARIRSSIDDYCALLDQLQEARNDPQHPIRETYRQMKPPVY